MNTTNRVLILISALSLSAFLSAAGSPSRKRCFSEFEPTASGPVRVARSRKVHYGSPTGTAHAIARNAMAAHASLAISPRRRAVDNTFSRFLSDGYSSNLLAPGLSSAHIKAFIATAIGMILRDGASLDAAATYLLNAVFADGISSARISDALELRNTKALRSFFLGLLYRTLESRRTV